LRKFQNKHQHFLHFQISKKNFFQSFSSDVNRQFADMDSLFGNFMDPFGMSSRRQAAIGGRSQSRDNQMALRDPFMSNPFALMSSMMGNMGGMMRGMDGMMHMPNDPNAQVFSSSTVMSYSNSGDGGAPKIYQASSQTTQMPGGLRETRRTIKDSEKGIEKMSIGHHLGEKAHVIERQRARDGQIEEIVNLENLDDSMN
jgi:myeloid leukemia factor 1